MNTKQQFLNAVQILAPGDKFLLKAAQAVREELLPQFPGAAALEFVRALQRLKPFVSLESTDLHQRQRPQIGRVKPARNHCAEERFDGNCGTGRLPFQKALIVKAAEYWLKLGQPDQAIIELQKLPPSTKDNPSVVKVLVAATHALRDSNEYAMSF